MDYQKQLKIQQDQLEFLMEKLGFPHYKIEGEISKIEIVEALNRLATKLVEKEGEKLELKEDKNTTNTL